jgi:hypothetical protein
MRCPLTILESPWSSAKLQIANAVGCEVFKHLLLKKAIKLNVMACVSSGF